MRIARVCPTKECDWRQFSDPTAVCPEHGRGIFQPNRPYLGRELEQPGECAPPSAPRGEELRR